MKISYSETPETTTTTEEGVVTSSSVNYNVNMNGTEFVIACILCFLVFKGFKKVFQNFKHVFNSLRTQS